MVAPTKELIMTAVLDLMLVLALLFFLFLPISDRRTVIMRLGMMSVIATLFVVSVTGAHGPSQIAQLPQTVAMGSN
jgi:hypothetical protein